MARKARNFHLGGQQLPLVTPHSDWQPPTELPDLPAMGVTRYAEDTETMDLGLQIGRGPGWGKGAGHICGVAVAWAGGSVYVPLRHPDTECRDPVQVQNWLTHCHKHCEVVYQNAGYDLGWESAEMGVPPPVKVHDTIAAAVQIDENRLSYELNSLCQWQDVPGKDESLLKDAAAAYGVDPKAGLHLMPARYVGPYAAQDAAATLTLFDKLYPLMEEQDVIEAYDLEMDIVPMVVAMRMRGIRVDLDMAHESRLALLRQRDAALAQIGDKLNMRVGMEEIRSPRFLERVFDELRIPYPRTAKTGQGSFTSDWMKSYDKHWLPPLVTRADQLDEGANKFLKGFIMDYAHKGRLHASINQYRGEDGGTRSHRFSYADPALQQAPARDAEMATAFRGVFLPEEGETWGSFDFGQQEYRLIVHFANISNLNGAAEAAARYNNDPKTDFHSYVAEITGLERKPAKDANFAKSYGAGPAKFAAMINKTVEEARAIMDQYDKELPFVRELSQLCQKLADRRGYIRLLDGARSHFDMWEPAWRDNDLPYQAPRPLAQARVLWPDIRLKRGYTHKASNRLVQGSAARQTKKAMKLVWQEGLTPLLQMHDELTFSLSSEKTAKRIVECMRDAVQLTVPMLVDAEFGKNWADAKHSWEENEKLKKLLIR